MPQLKPGQTVRIATLPEGLDPDDIILKQGRDAFAAVIERARPLSEMIWAMETRGVLPETPEARAALEMRLRERANSIGDASVKRHYLQAFDEKLSAFFAPVRSGRFEGRGRGNGRDQRPSYAQRGRNSPRLVVSDTLRNSRLLKPACRAMRRPREAAIIMSLINFPALAESRMEMLAELELVTPAARQLLIALLDLIGRDHDIDSTALGEALGARGFGEAIERMRLLLGAAGRLADDGRNRGNRCRNRTQARSGPLHYKSVRLNRDLKAAELELGADLSEESFEKLRDIQNQITTVDGTEALIEGFGSLSGRATRSF